MKNINVFNLTIIFTLFIIIILLIKHYRTEQFLEELKPNSNNEDKDKNSFDSIPKIIWTYWHEPELPSLLKKFINTWKKHNPDFKIIILNNKNLKTFLPTEDLDILNDKKDKTPTRFSDIVRYNILYEYGGIWSDISIICLKSYNSILKEMENKNLEYYGYLHNDNPHKDQTLISSWFFVCVPNSILLKDIVSKMNEVKNFDKVYDFIKDMEKSIDTNSLKTHHKIYLWNYIITKYLLSKENNYKLSLIKPKNIMHCRGGAKKLLNLIKQKQEGHKKFKNNYIIKFCGILRKNMFKEEHNLDLDYLIS